VSGREDPRAIDAPRRVLIVEDHPMLAEALDQMLRREPTLSVIGTEGTIAGAVATAARESPDLVVMDQHLPDGRGTDAAQAIHRRDPRIRVVMLTGDAADDTLLAAIEAGVAGFIPKGKPASEIIALLVRAASGELVVPADDLARLLRNQREHQSREHETRRVTKELTPRDREILDLVAQGVDTREIATRTGLAVSTVRGHVQAIIEKLETHSRLEAVLRAAALGLVRRPDERTSA
jgi:DNA-binding NarL/FixJ family response regulator